MLYIVGSRAGGPLVSQSVSGRRRRAVGVFGQHAQQTGHETRQKPQKPSVTKRKRERFSVRVEKDQLHPAFSQAADAKPLLAINPMPSLMSEAMASRSFLASPAAIAARALRC